MLTEVQNNLLELLKEFTNFCRKHDIEFYMGGGCLVGAIRNGGFLPWDDDVDVHMTRDNYEKFLKVQDEFPEGCIIVNREKYADYPEIHFRYMNTSRTTSLRSLFLQNSPAGQFIDILVLYPVPDGDDIQCQIIKDFNTYLEITSRHIINSSLRDDELISLYIQSRDKNESEFLQLCRALEKRLFEYEECYCNSYLVRGPSAPRLIYSKALWGTPRWIKFENTYVPVAEKAEEVLMLAYGDRWIDIPEVGDRGVHVFLNDQDIPCNVYKHELDKYVQSGEFLRFLYEKKDNWFLILSDRNYLNSRLRYIHHHLVHYKVIRNIITKHVNLKKLAEQKKYIEIKSVFKEYYTQQFIDAKYYKVFIPLSDLLIYYAMLPLLHEGDYSKVKKVITLRIQNNKKALSNNLKKLDRICDICRSITNNIYTFFDYEIAREEVNNLIVDYPELITIIRADIVLDIKMGKCTRDTKKRLIKYLHLYPYDGELIKYYGDILKLEGSIDAAIRYYKKAYGFIRNGMVQKEIRLEFEKIRESG